MYLAKHLGFDPRKPILDQFPQEDSEYGVKLPLHFRDIDSYIFSVGAPKAVIAPLLPPRLRLSSWYAAFEHKDPIIQIMCANVLDSSLGPFKCCYVLVPAKPEAGGLWGGYLLWFAGDPICVEVFKKVWAIPTQKGDVVFEVEDRRIEVRVLAADGTTIEAVGKESPVQVGAVQVWHFYVKDGDKIRGNDNWFRSYGSSVFQSRDAVKINGPLRDLIGGVLDAATYVNLQAYHKSVGVHCAHSREV